MILKFILTWNLKKMNLMSRNFDFQPSKYFIKLFLGRYGLPY